MKLLFEQQGFDERFDLHFIDEDTGKEVCNICGTTLPEIIIDDLGCMSVKTSIPVTSVEVI